MDNLKFLRGLPLEAVTKAAEAHAKGLYEKTIQDLKDLHLLDKDEQRYRIAVIEEARNTAYDMVELGVFQDNPVQLANLKRIAQLDIERLLIMNKFAQRETDMITAYNKQHNIK
jgi:hypothetical protein